MQRYVSSLFFFVKATHQHVVVDEGVLLLDTSGRFKPLLAILFTTFVFFSGHFVHFEPVLVSFWPRLASSSHLCRLFSHFLASFCPSLPT